MTSQSSGPIQFTQYLLPSGEPRRVTINRPMAVVDQARRIIERGARLETELLRTGEVSLTIEYEHDNNGEIESLAHEVVPNGPEVPLAVDRLIATAFGVL